MRWNVSPGGKPRGIGALCLVVGLLLAGCGDGGSDPVIPNPPAASDLRIGALLSLSGNQSTFGQASRAALELARDDMNAALAQEGSSAQVTLLVGDTQHSPLLAEQRLRELAAQGVRIVIGPQSSAEAQAVRDLAQQRGILILSHGSTAGSLSIPGDNLFRFIPDDSQEARALAALLREDGLDTVVPLWRADAGNEGLVLALRQAFPAVGGVVTAGISYSLTETDFADELAVVRQQVEAAAAQGATVGIYLAAFDEVAPLFLQARADPFFAGQRWYGSDSAALNQPLIDSPAAAQFAATVGYPNPLFGLADDQSARWQPVEDRVRAQAGLDAGSQVLSAYDALQIATRALLQVGNAAEVEALKAALMQVAGSFDGITGATALNAAGDRASGRFDFWAVRPTDGTFAWRRVAAFVPAPGGTGGTIERFE